MNVVELTVKNDYCIGCGVCAGICPSNNLHMDWSPQGELIPFANNTCNDKCSICLDICPFYDHEINQDDIANSLFSQTPEIKYDEYTGYYLNCYVGFQKDEKKRLKSASGGLATSFLSSLLEENVVDKVIAVGVLENSDRMFDFKILSNSNEVYSCAGSAYYPVEISRVLKEILKEKEDETYAVIALPCVVYALRLAMDKIPKLKRKVKIIASLTCGQLQNRFYAEFLALESGILVDTLSKIDFRRKLKENPASNFMQVAIDKEGNEGIHQANWELPHHLWHYRYFTQNACNFCDDIFGEVADITFMDAWLPKYVNDYKGNSLIITRTILAKNLLENYIDKHICTLHPIYVENVIKSQSTPIYKKREILVGRLYRTKKIGLWHPQKRVIPNIQIYKKNQRYIELTTKVQEKSKEIFPNHFQDKSSEEFWDKMKDIEVEIKKFERLQKIKTLKSMINNLNPITKFKGIIKGEK